MVVATSDHGARSRPLFCRSVHRRLGRHGLHHVVTSRLSIVDGTGAQSFYLWQSHTIRNRPDPLPPTTGECVFDLQVCGCGAGSPRSYCLLGVGARRQPVALHGDYCGVLDRLFPSFRFVWWSGNDRRSVSSTPGDSSRDSSARHPAETFVDDPGRRRSDGAWNEPARDRRFLRPVVDARAICMRLEIKEANTSLH